MKKKLHSLTFSIFFALAFFISSCKNNPSEQKRIFLLGEVHSNPLQLAVELEEWQKAYSLGMRHLFIETGYCSSQILNEWMHSDDDVLFDIMFGNIEGTAVHSQSSYNLYHSIKQTCPETVFHGIDVEHQHDTNGKFFLEMLKKKGLDGTPLYALCVENSVQAVKYYESNDEVYRENCMVQNFIREFDSLPSDEKIYGIFGAAHTRLAAKNLTKKVPCMANQLNRHYKKTLGQIISSRDLTYINSEQKPISFEEIKIGRKTYLACYMGQEDISAYSRDFVSRKFWRIQDSSSDFKSKLRLPDVLPYSSYPFAVHTGDVFKIEYFKADGTSKVWYYRSDGRENKEYGFITSQIWLGL